MKKKMDLKKKISFSKDTIAKLNNKQKEMLKGGAAPFGTGFTGSCPSYAYTCNG